MVLKKKNTKIISRVIQKETFSTTKINKPDLPEGWNDETDDLLKNVQILDLKQEMEE